MNSDESCPSIKRKFIGGLFSREKFSLPSYLIGVTPRFPPRRPFSGRYSSPDRREKTKAMGIAAILTQDVIMRRLCVFCGSSTGRRAVYSDSARRLGAALVARGWGLVYGAG